MTNFVRKTGLLGALFSLLIAGGTHAANIAGVSNTGVDDGGVALADNALDSHWVS